MDDNDHVESGAQGPLPLIEQPPQLPLQPVSLRRSLEASTSAQSQASLVLLSVREDAEREGGAADPPPFSINRLEGAIPLERRQARRGRR